MTLALVEARDVAGLPEDAFNRFLGELVWLEAIRQNIHPSKVNRTDKTKANDDGIDLRLAQGAAAPGWLPSSESTWQFKSGACPSARELAGATTARPTKAGKVKTPEFKKLGVLDAIARKAMYVFAAADDITDKKKAEIRAAFINLHGAEARICVYGAADLAVWASELPAVAAHHFPRVGWLARWSTHSDWASFPSMARPFHPDKARTDLIAAIKDAISRGDRFVHVAGRAGDGKTRLALEAVRSPDLASRALYLPEQAEFDRALVSHAQGTKMNALLVVDECEDIEELRKTSEQFPPGCVIIGIGHQQSTMTTLRLPGLAKEPLAAMLIDMIPGLENTEAQRIVLRCGESPKLVAFLAANPPADWKAIESAAGIEEWLREAYPLDKGDEQRVMYAICMFSRLGRYPPYEQELTALAVWLNVDRAAVAAHIDAILVKGILSPRGYSVYPTPDVLANILARKAVEDFGHDRVLLLLKGMPQRARESFAERLQQIGTDAYTSKIEEVLFGPKGLFRDAKVLSDGELAAVARISALAFPTSAVRNYDLLLGGHDDLVKVDGSARRELVWALEALAWPAETFAQAARLLKLLAIAENEMYGNNATGCFIALFPPVLGATSAPYELRYPVLEGMFDGESCERELLSKAIQAGLKLDHVSRSGGSPEIHGAPLDEWTPTRSAHRGIVVRLLSMLTRLMRDRSEGVRAASAAVLASETWGLVFAGLHDEWASAARILADERFELRQPILERIQALIHFHRKRLSAPAREVVDRTATVLAPQSVLDRLRLEIRRWPQEREGETSLKDLACAFLSDNSSITAGLVWLSGGEASSAWEFGIAVAAEDVSRSLLAPIASMAPADIEDDRFVGGYLSQMVSSGSEAIVNEVLDRWSGDQERIGLSASLSYRLGATARNISRITDLIAGGLLPGSFLLRLTLGFYLRDASPAELAALLHASSTDTSEGARRGRIHVLNQYVSHHKGPDELKLALRQAAMKFVDAAWDGMDEHIWNEAVAHAFDEGSLELAELLLKTLSQRMKAGNSSSTSALRARLSGAVDRLSEEQRWRFFVDRLGPALVNCATAGVMLLGRRGGALLPASIDIDKLVAWVEEDVEHRLWPIASAAPLGGVPMAELTRRLLIKWGTRREVTGALSASFGTGGWSGPASGYFRARVELLAQWEKDPAPQVALFARTLRKSYVKHAEEAEKIEADRGY